MNGRCTQASQRKLFLQALLCLLGAFALMLTFAFATQAHEAAATDLSMFQTDHFSGAGQCASCHADLTDESGADVSNGTLWRSTMMANAAKDPVWQAKVEAEMLRNPNITDVVEEKCARCHMPMAYTEAQDAGTDIAIFDDGFLNPAHSLHDAAMDGVSCTVCHQISPTNLGTEASFSGGFEIDMVAGRPNRTLYGPYQNPQSFGYMKWASGFVPTYGGHMDNSALCATCHTLYVDAVDENGADLGIKFAEQMVYREWQESAFGDGAGDDQSCQSCHMPLADGGVQIANVLTDSIPFREPFYKHYFVGGNAFMLRMLRDRAADLGVTATTEQFNETIARTQNLLGNQTATLTIQDAQAINNNLQFDAQIDSLVGHKLPSGISMRRAWLHVTVRDAANRVVFESGAPQANGRIAGANGDSNAAAFEPHMDTISSADQVQIYEAVMHDNDNDVTHSLMQATGYLKDNRLLPSGFVKAGADWDVAVLGAALADGDFVGGGDTVTYQVDVSGHEGPFLISAEFLYQSLSAPFINDLTSSSGTYIDRFAGWFNAADHTPETIASVTQSVSVTPTQVSTIDNTANTGNSWTAAIGALALLMVTALLMRQRYGTAIPKGESIS